MTPAQREVFQGITHYYYEERAVCRYDVTLRDAVDPACLQAALDAARPLAPYFFQKVVWCGREAHLEPHDAPCLVWEGAAQPMPPEQTDGYLFSLHYLDRTVYLDWFHFLTDGRGGARFLTLLLQAYCNCRYGEAFACAPLASDAPYDIEELLARCPRSAARGGLKAEGPDLCEGVPTRVRLRLDRQRLVELAVGCGVKPFSALTALLCRGVRAYLEKPALLCRGFVDVRGAMEAPNALYNCIASFRRPLGAAELDAPFAALASGLDADIRAELTPERQRLRLAEQMGWVYQVFQQKAALSIKKRVFQMGASLGGFPSDFWVSYLGDPFCPADPRLEAYVEDIGAWVCPESASLCVEAVRFRGTITLCIENRSPRPGLTAALRAALEREGIPVRQTEELGPMPTK